MALKWVEHSIEDWGAKLEFDVYNDNQIQPNGGKRNFLIVYILRGRSSDGLGVAMPHLNSFVSF
jgi:hypothetical protein